VKFDFANRKCEGYRPLRGLNVLCRRSCPGVRCAHPGLYAAVRYADLLSVLSTKGTNQNYVARDGY
jgi:hypothetical protein